MPTRLRKMLSGRSRLLRFECLAARITLDGTASAAAALPWFDPAELTFSFVPDGTVLGSEQSSLFAELAPTGSELEWQGEFEKAFDQWLSKLGAGITRVSDSGLPFGAFGPTQGDARFGDIRIGAVPLAGNVMAEAVPHSIITQGSWAGDILLNSNADWSNLHQVYSVALHEFGHVLGLGHSEDLNSPMFFHGVYDAMSPTVGDAAELRKLYAGFDLHAAGGESNLSGEGGSEWREEPHFSFDASQAVPLSAVLAASARYATSGELSSQVNSILYQLEPIGEIDHAEYLNVVVSAKHLNGLIPVVAVYDHSGDRVRSRVLHNSEGVLVIQASGFEPNQTYFIAVTPAATAAEFQVGDFDLFAEYSIPKLMPTEIGRYALTAERPIVEQDFEVKTSRLVHVLVASSTDRTKSANAAVWGTMIDVDGRVLAQFAMNLGGSRSVPLIFLAPGNYKLIIESGTRDGNQPAATTVAVYVDEISIDVGPGVVDPATEPLISCDVAGADPLTCKDPGNIILTDGPIFPDPNVLPPSPTYPSLPPWDSPPWFYWPTFLPTLPVYRHNTINALDVSGDQLVTALDALLIINELNAASAAGSDAFLDTNGDGMVSSIDVLLVINMLNSKSTAEGEGTVSSLVDSVNNQVVDLLAASWAASQERKHKGAF